VSPQRLSCPACHHLLHKRELEELAREAGRAADSGELRSEIHAWRRALELLPPESRQHASISEKVSALSRRLEQKGDAVADATSTGREARSASKGRWRWAALGAAALLAWKLKSVLVFVLTKGKLLLVGLTKSGTSLSMLFAFGVYWAAFGWKFAAGLIVSIYIHEMGHVAALHRLGIRASAPMFIPGFGAFVRLNQYPVDAREDARVGLAGPIWGLAAAGGAAVILFASGAPIWGAIARFGAWINLFNLLPVWQLDGSRGFRALSRLQRIIVTGAMGAAWLVTGEGLLLLVGLAAALRAWGADAPEEGEATAFVQFLMLVVALSGLCLLPVPVP
jgi:Zn-dependent protease